MSGAFEGITVLDLSVGIQGPYCAMLLADMGASVIKVERPDVGEGMRYMYLSHITPGVGSIYAGVNRGKRSLALDIRPEPGQKIFLELVKRSDVVVQNFRPGVMERLGYGWEDLAKVHPGIIMASLSGYGESGPHAQRAGQDLLAQAYAGIIALQGYDDDDPQAVGSPIADTIGAISGAWGVAVALYARAQTGQGQEVTSNLADALLALSPVDWADYLHSGELRKGGRGWFPNMPYGPWRAKDRSVVVNLQGEMGWGDFCTVIEAPDLADDPRFKTNLDRVSHRRELEAILKPIFRTRTAEEWRTLFEGMGLRCDPVYSYRDLEQDPQTQVNQMIVEQTHPRYGKVRTVGQAVKLKGTPGVATHPDHPAPPVFAEHTVEILHELGYDDASIAALEEQEIINTQGLPDGVDMHTAMSQLMTRRRATGARRL